VHRLQVAAADGRGGGEANPSQVGPRMGSP
jgi:hypothetical protein